MDFLRFLRRLRGPSVQERKIEDEKADTTVVAEQPPPVQVLPEPEKTEEEKEKDRLAHQFRIWLDRFDNILDEAVSTEEIEIKTDLFTLVSEFVALKNEVKRESRQFKATFDNYKSSLELLQSGYEALMKEQEARKKERDVSRNELMDMALRMIIVEILDIRDRIEEGLRMLKNKKPSLIKRMFKIKDTIVQSIIEGQEMILGRMDRMLLSHGVIPIVTKDKVLNPHLMRAIEIDSISEIEDGIVLEEIRKGFMIKDEIIRVAEVKVNKQQGEIKL